MRERVKKIVISVMVALGMLMPVMPVVASVPVMAVADVKTVFGEKIQTNLFNEVEIDANGGGIKQLLNLVVNILLYGIGAAAVIGVVIAGIIYLTARDNEAQVAKAKTRLIEVAIGLVAWAVLFSLLQWLIPGFNESDLESRHIVTDSILV